MQKCLHPRTELAQSSRSVSPANISQVSSVLQYCRLLFWLQVFHCRSVVYTLEPELGRYDLIASAVQIDVPYELSVYLLYHSL